MIIIAFIKYEYKKQLKLLYHNIDCKYFKEIYIYYMYTLYILHIYYIYIIYNIHIYYIFYIYSIYPIKVNYISNC